MSKSSEPCHGSRGQDDRTSQAGRRRTGQLAASSFQLPKRETSQYRFKLTQALFITVDPFCGNDSCPAMLWPPLRVRLQLEYRP
jgi:hypothetical protein